MSAEFKDNVYLKIVANVLSFEPPKVKKILFEELTGLLK